MKDVVNASATVAQKIRGGDTYGKLIGHWWSEIGKMNQYVHMWEYKDPEEMRRLRSELAAKEDWKNKFVPLVGPNILTQEIRLLRPLTEIKKPVNSSNIYELKIIKLNIGQSAKWAKNFLEIVDLIENSSINIGIWNTELQDPNEIISLWSHPNLENMSKYWYDLESNKDWNDFNNYQQNSVKSEENIILKSSVCSPLQ